MTPSNEILNKAINKFPSAKQYFVNGFEVTKKNCFGISFLFENKLFRKQQLRDVIFNAKNGKVICDKIVEEKYI